MKKLTVLLSGILLLALFAGCSASANTLDALPAGAQLVHSQAIGGDSGRGVTYPGWQAGAEEGQLVVEILCESGSLSGLKLEYSTDSGGGSAGLGKFSREATLMGLDDFYVPGAIYAFTISRLSAFRGTLNVYLVPA